MKIVFICIVASLSSLAQAFVAPNQAGTRSTALNAAALIVQNKGGGHGELGFQLAKVLSGNDKIDSITILQDDAANMESEPFCSYATDIGDVTIVKAPLADETMDATKMQALLGSGTTFDYVWDNASKGAKGAGKAVVDCAKSWGCNLLTYVSSAGAYNPTADTTYPMDEATTPVKESAGQVLYEQYATASGVPFCSFRPQYIYGPKSNKYDYVDWYFDRLTRGLPLPIPGDGSQLVSLTNSEDVASLLASVLNDEAAAASGAIFNCGTDQLVSYNEVAKLCAEVSGVVDYSVCHYDGAELGKGKFPFRLTDFYVAPTKAKSALGWSGAAHSLRDDLTWYYKDYVASRADKPIKLDADWDIVSKTADGTGSAPKYEKYGVAITQSA
uniref:NAD-dependent epimerase/dehydratase domain-containing protein n=1 Tax=Grammatophora oceanica TaxID=210454 RepID=A0A7S1YH04_9STRA